MLSGEGVPVGNCSDYLAHIVYVVSTRGIGVMFESVVILGFGGTLH